MGALSKTKFWFTHWLKAVDQHSLHSPFIYALYTETIRNDVILPQFEMVEDLRVQLWSDSSTINILEMGAGSSVNSSTSRKVSDIARNSLTPPRISRLIFRLATEFQSKKILELGTALGINTLYLSQVQDSIVTTIEGCPETAQKARQTFETFGSDNIHLEQGNIDEVLPVILDKSDGLDLVFLDANHRYQPTLDYFNLLIDKVHENSILIFDDIYWSKDMARAWNEISSDPRITFSIDLFHLGIAGFLPGLTKQHFRLQF